MVWKEGAKATMDLSQRNDRPARKSNDSREPGMSLESLREKRNATYNTGGFELWENSLSNDSPISLCSS
jgi:hypothetical protein